MNLEQLRARLVEIIERMAVIAARSQELGGLMEPLLTRSEPSEAEVADLDSYRTEFEALEAEAGSGSEGLAGERAETERLIALYERAIAAQGDSVVRGDGAPNVHRSVDPYERSLDDVGRHEVRDLAMRAIEGDDVMDDEQRGQAEQVVRAHGPAVARHMLATNRPAYRDAWMMAMGGQESLLSDAQRAAVIEMRAMSLVDTAGGYAVPFTLDPTVINTSDGTVSPIRAIARNETTMTDSWNGVSSAGVTARWAAEASEADDNSPTFTNPAIPVHKADSFVPYSFEIGMDFAALAGEVQRMQAQARDDLEAVAHLTGNGTTAPTGILTALNGVGGSNVAAATGGVFASADLRGLWRGLPAKYRNRATYVMNAVNLDVAQAFGNNGDADFSVYLTAEGAQTLKGRPTAEASEMADDKVLFGDFQSYVVVDRIGMVTSLVPHLFGANSRPTGQSGYYAYWRTGADSVNDGAFRLLTIQP